MGNFIKSIKIDEVADKFNNKEIFSLNKIKCNVCSGELEIIEILNAEELLVYCNSCKLFHIVNLTEKNITVYNLEKNKKEINKITEFNYYILIIKRILTIITIGLVLYSVYSLFFKQRWVQTLILIAFSVITGIYNFILLTNELNKDALLILKMCKNKNFTKDIFLDPYYDRDISFIRKKR